MSLVLLPNNVLASTAKIYVTDAANSELTDTSGIQSITGGPRNVFYTSGSTGAHRLVYVNKLGGLACSHIVLAQAYIHNTRAIDLISWTAYPGTANTEFTTASFAETLVGRKSFDWVYPVTLSGKQGIGISFATAGYTKLAYKFFVSNGLTLNYPQPCSFRYLRHPTRHIYQRQMYLVDVEWNFTIDSMTRSEINSFESIANLQSEPMFLYDSSGYMIHYKLIHGVIANYETTAVADDLFRLSFKMLELRQWA
jgi:hypothetical protein